MAINLDERRENIFVCPPQIFDVDDLNSIEKLLYIFFYRVDSQYFRLSNFTNSYIAEKIGTSEKTVERALKKLSKKGYLRVSKNGDLVFEREIYSDGSMSMNYDLKDPVDVWIKRAEEKTEEKEEVEKVVKKPTRKLRNPLNPNRIG